MFLVSCQQKNKPLLPDNIKKSLMVVVWMVALLVILTYIIAV
jgi:hypothetical protein